VNDTFGARLWALFVHPHTLMRSLKERPAWVAASLIMLVMTALYTASVVHISGPEQLELMRDSKLMRAMPEAKWQQQYQASLNPTLLKRVGSGLGGGIGTWVSAFLLAAILHGFCRMSGGKGRFKHMLSLVYWTGLIPFGLAHLLRLPLVLIKESQIGVTLGLGALAGGLGYTSFVYQLLVTYGDFAIWWALVLLVIGVKEVYELSRAAATVTVILPWALLSGVMFAISRLIM
jgi:hypothetical protein